MKTGKILDFNKICLWTVLSLLSLVCPRAMALTTEEIVGLGIENYDYLWTADPVLLPENYNGVLYIEPLTADGKTWEAYEYCRNHSLEVSVSNPDILELREEGCSDYGWTIGVNAKGAGTTVISFKIEGTSITLAKEVKVSNNVEITDIQIKNVNTSMLVEGAEITLNVRRTPYWSAEPIEWISSNPEIMQLISEQTSGNSAKFALVGAGECEITVRSVANPAVYATKTFTVATTPPLKSIYIRTPSAFESELAKDFTYKFIAEGNPSIFSDRLMWSSSDESVLRIEPDGDSVLVTGVSLGEAILSVKSVDNPDIEA